MSERVLSGAVLAFRHRMGLTSWDGNGPAVLARPRRIIWYAGQLIARGTIVVVAFEADSREGHRLVTGFAPADAVQQGEPGWQEDEDGSSESPWTIRDSPAPAPRPGLAIGINASARGQGPNDDWVVQLTSPNVTSLTWRVPVGWPAARHQVEGRARRGMAVADFGHVSAAITLASIAVGHRQVLENVLVGVPGDSATTVPDLIPPALRWLSSREQLQEWGQGPGATNVDGSRIVLTGICYGPAPMTFFAQGTGTAPELRLGKIRCNDQRHSLAWTGTSAFISWRTSPLTAWNFVTAGVPGPVNVAAGLTEGQEINPG